MPQSGYQLETSLTDTATYEQSETINKHVVISLIKEISHAFQISTPVDPASHISPQNRWFYKDSFVHHITSTRGQ